MSYHATPYQNIIYKQANQKPQNTNQQDSQVRQRTNSGKKITFIKRKVSNPSLIQTKDAQNNILQNHNHNNNQYLQHNQQSNQQIREAKRNHLQINDSIMTLNPQNIEPSVENHHQTNKGVSVNKQSFSSSLQHSRGQFYQQQLQNIHQEVQFFTHRLQAAEQKNRQLQNHLSRKEHEFQVLIKNVYSFINRLFSSQIDLLSESMEIITHSQDRFLFHELIEKNSGLHQYSIGLKEFQNDMTLIAKTLNLTLLNQVNLNQILKSQQITLNANMNEIDRLKNQNRNITHEYRQLQNQNRNTSHQYHQLQKIINQKPKIRLIPRQTQTLPPKISQKTLDQSKKTADASRQEIIKQRKHVQIQTQEKRIGSAASIHKYKSYRFQNTPSRPSPYKNYLKERSISNCSKQSSKQSNSLGSRINKQLQKGQTLRKNNPYRYTNTQQSKKVTQKKKLPATSSYLNHLIQSENYIKGDETLETLDNRSNRFQQQIDTSKSQLSIRRPIHRSRSQSQQEVPSSRQRSQTKNSLNNTSSRVVSTYSLNPVNQYGQKRLCNEMNGKRVRKITQLSQESESLSQRMKELMEEQQMLKKRYKQLQQIKVSRENKKSRLNKSSQNKNKQVL